MKNPLLMPLIAVLSALLVPQADGKGGEPPAKPYVMMVLAHPDDFEGCAGLAFRMKDDYRVQVVDFTRGEGGCGPEGFRDGTTAVRRVAEERAVTAPLGVEPIFLSQTNFQGRLAFANAQVTREIEDLLLRMRPRAVFTHWPCDSHPDHVQCFAATLHALDQVRRDHGFATELIFVEETVQQTTNFHPTHFVDVTPVMPLLEEQLPKYACQNGPKILANKKERNAAWGLKSPKPVAFAEPYEAYGFNPKFKDGSVLDRYASRCGSEEGGLKSSSGEERIDRWCRVARNRSLADVARKRRVEE